jgi:glycosyltransferase involved in cell wall biosynthesis
MAARQGHSRGPRVTYWTGWLSPDMEGCSKDVFALKDHFPRSRVFGLSRYYAFKLSPRQRYLGLNIRLYPVFRALAPLVEWASDINHVYGSLNEWFFLRALRRRPILLTVATSGEAPDPSLHRHVTCFVAHSPTTTAELERRGVEPHRIRTIYPGVALDRFVVRPREASLPNAWPESDSRRFRVLFATTPNWEAGLETRGVHLIMRAARRLPDVDFFLPWRPWHNAEALIRLLVREHGRPANVHLIVQRVPDMVAVYQASDATVAPFVETAGTKICPTSIVESLACGRPVLVSSQVGLAGLIRDEGCGVVFEPTPDALCEAVESLRRDHAARAAHARPCAERHFDQRVCLRRHEALYEELLNVWP